jgi:hypothetical protein
MTTTLVTRLVHALLLLAVIPLVACGSVPVQTATQLSALEQRSAFENLALQSSKSLRECECSLLPSYRSFDWSLLEPRARRGLGRSAECVRKKRVSARYLSSLELSGNTPSAL